MRAAEDPRVAEAERGGALPDIDDAKAASHIAELQSVGAMVGLRKAAALGYHTAHLWVGKLMNCGLLFEEILTNTYYLSLGFHSAGGICWQVCPLGPADENGKQYFSLVKEGMGPEEARTKLQLSSSNENEEEYAGVPTTVCFSAQIELLFLKNTGKYFLFVIINSCSVKPNFCLQLFSTATWVTNPRLPMGCTG